MEPLVKRRIENPSFARQAAVRSKAEVWAHHAPPGEIHRLSWAGKR